MLRYNCARMSPKRTMLLEARQTSNFIRSPFVCRQFSQRLFSLFVSESILLLNGDWTLPYLPPAIALLSSCLEWGSQAYIHAYGVASFLEAVSASALHCQGGVGVPKLITPQLFNTWYFMNRHNHIPHLSLCVEHINLFAEVLCAICRGVSTILVVYLAL